MTTGIDGTVGAQVRAARRARAVSLRGLAAMLHVSPATVSQIETGKTGIGVARLGRIAECLGTTVPQILEIQVNASAAALEPIETVGTADEPPPELTITNWREYAPLDFDPVLSAALEEFLSIGYHGATVRGIAARSGLSVPGIYHHYASKQAMLVTLFDRTMTELLSRSTAARADGRDPVKRFGLLVENLVLFHTHRKELGAVGSSEMRSFEPANRQRIARLRTIQQRMVDREVEQAVHQNRFRADCPHDAARAVVTMCTALPTWWRRDGPLTPEQVAEQYVGFALELMSNHATS